MATKYKYPRTKHLPWSEGRSEDDISLVSTDAFRGLEVVVTEKLDGENTTLYRDYMHARSLETPLHPSQNWIKAFHAGIRYLIPEGFRICGENLYARHSIPYNNLQSYFYLFSIWTDTNECLNWDETMSWAQSLKAAIPQILYRGIWDEQKIRALQIDTQKCEGYVVRIARSFPL